MQHIFLLIFMMGTISLSANAYRPKSEGCFAAWTQKRLELCSFFLPANPVILQAGGHYGNEPSSLVDSKFFRNFGELKGFEYIFHVL